MSIKKFKAEITNEARVVFREPEKAKAFFVDGDWKHAFWEIESLEDLACNIAKAVADSPEDLAESENKKTFRTVRKTEGFGKFFRTRGQYVYEMNSKSSGLIQVFFAGHTVSAEEVTND